MDITFTRTNEGACKATAVRDDGVTVAVLGSPGRKAALPHDLVHYVVESELRLERGFWGRVAAGALVSGVVVVSGQQKMARHHFRMLIRQAKREGNEIEDLVQAFRGLAFNEAGSSRSQPPIPEEILYFYRERVKPFSPDEINRTIAALLDAQRKWESLRPGDRITLTWPVGLRAKKNRPNTRKKVLTRSW